MYLTIEIGFRRAVNTVGHRVINIMINNSSNVTGLAGNTREMASSEIDHLSYEVNNEIFI